MDGFVIQMKNVLNCCHQNHRFKGHKNLLLVYSEIESLHWCGIYIQNNKIVTCKLLMNLTKFNFSNLMTQIKEAIEQLYHHFRKSISRDVRNQKFHVYKRHLVAKFRI